MDTDEMPRLGGWRQAWRLGAAAAAGVPVWLSAGVLLADGQAAETGSWFATGDPLVALGCLLLLLWRRRFPLAVAMTVAIASTASMLATGAALLALTSISTRRRPVETGAVVLAYVVASSLAVGLYPVEDGDGATWLERGVIPALTAGIAVALGTAVGARRVEIRSLRERAESAEREQAARAAQARALERNRIAREMHDVLAHRISLVAMQAGVLGHRSDLGPEESSTLLRGIADGSQQALEELRDVLGVLRAGPDRPEPPQPSLDRVPELVDDARTSGVDATLVGTVSGTPSDTLGRTCYRVVQEGLTNAAKHAPGACVSVTLEGAAGGELRVTVRNSRANSRANARTERPPSSGFGLSGLGERVTLADGTLDHGPAPDGGYILIARLPWPHQPQER
ncbi:sensor histidine kinase [Streptomyces xinghaiensis]|uniref:sensor histidine kinase n=1 Tax=Streptomyces xinghaiensis TaxID=1038928 RepID=UPI002E156B9D|nr:histidine kinase [Streptomyces xinghaiensis]